MSSPSNRKNVEDIYRLSPVQQGMLFHTVYAPESGVYFEQFNLRYDSGFSPEVFTAVWRRILERHPVLRTSFLWEDLEEPVQVVHRRLELPVETLDWRALPPEEQEERSRTFLAEDRRKGFDLARPPLMRLSMIRTGDDEYQVVFSYHHLLLDGWSVGLVMREVAELYRAELTGTEAVLPERRPFRDYVRWLRQQDSEEARAYWRRRLGGFTEPTHLAADGPGGGADAGYELRLLEMSEEETARLKAFAQGNRLTLSTVVHAAYALVLSRYSGQDDVVYGVTVSGRPATLAGVDGMIGCFINTLPLRAIVDPDAEVLPWLGWMQTAQTELRKYEHSSLVDVLACADVPRNRELFDSILVFESFTADAAFEMTHRGVFQRTNYPLTVVAAPATRMVLRAGYELAHFTADAIDRLLGYLRQALAEIVARPEARLRNLRLVPEPARPRALAPWHRPERDFRDGRTPHGLFAERARQAPDRPALTFDGRTLSYGELDRAANRLAHRLMREGVGPETLVGLCHERSLETVVGILGILKAGGAYLPLDPNAPAERLRFMIEDSGSALVVTGGAATESLPSGGARLVRLDAEAEAIAAESCSDPGVALAPEHLAYVIYTSGSTGRPKGSLITHENVQRLLGATQAWFSFGPDDVWTLFHSFAFDFSVWEIWGALAYGGRLVVVPYWVSRSPDRFLELLVRERVTVLNQTPSAFQQLVAALEDRRLPPGALALRRVVFGGEALEPASLAPWLARHGDREPVLINMYGITETTVHVTYRPMAAVDCEGGTEGCAGSPVGVPIPDLQVHLADPWLQLVPEGVAGEVLVGGAGLARGYLGRPGLTAERFVPDPFAGPDAAGARLYRAGDLASRLGDGGLDFLGRIDHQVKVRGFRIELGEIEAVLARHPAVARAAVLARREGPGDLRLVAYVVARQGAEARAPELREHAAGFLPDYMVPAAFVELPELPLTVNGKLDRAALPAPEAIAPLAPAEAFEPPATPTEELLAGVWAAVLRVERVGRADDFFELGGHSLLATRVVSRVRELLGVSMPLRALFEAPSLAGTAARIDEARRAARTGAVPAIVPEPREAGAPLSFAQERLWFLDRMEPGGSAYNVPGALRLEGRLELGALAGALAALVRRHESLRTVFETRGGAPVQVVRPAVRAPLPLVDLAALPETAASAELRRLGRRLTELPFDLAAGPLLRVVLVRLAPADHAAIVTLHHVISDAWSLALFVRELAALYAAAVEGRPSALPELPVQYSDFAAWQRRWLTGDALAEQLEYWRRRLAGAPTALALPTDRPRPPVQSYRGATLPGRLPAALAEGLNELARRQGATLFMVLMAGFQALLARYSGQDDLVVGSTIANRTHPEVQGLIGFFVNTFALRLDLSDAPGFGALVERVREESLGAYDHQDLPFEKLVQEIQPQRDLSRSPLFQVVLQLQNVVAEPLRLPGLTLSPVLADSQTAKFDLVLNFAERGPGAGIDSLWRYKSDLFDRTTVRRMARHLEALLRAAVADPARPVADLPLLGGAELHELMVEKADAPALAWPPGTAPGPVAALHELFEARTAADPGAPAVTAQGETWSYGELDTRANRLARLLREHGVGPGVPVALCLERSAAIPMAVLAVLKAGGAYVPLDPAYPAERLAFTLGDCGARVVVTEEPLLETLPPAAGAGIEVVCLDRDRERIEERPAARLPRSARPGDLAYVIYTSGSTGRPKGVPVTHANAVRLLTATDGWFGFGPGDVWTLFHSYAFDFSVWETWGALAYGGRLVVVPLRVSRSPETFHRLLADEGVTVLNQTPSAFRQLVRADAGAQPLSALRLVVFGGEALELASLAPWIERYGDRRPELVNMYGITETTVHVTYRPIRARDVAAGRGSVIGRPIGDLRLYVLDPAGRPVPAGVAGEIHVGGAGLARGYLGRPELTAERFVPDPFAPRLGAAGGGRLYRTGDLARFRPGGDLEYLGRIDHQVKVRGFRIELGEIESALAAHPAVAEAVVLARESGGEDGRRLVAYVVPAGEAPASVELRRHLSEVLPEYMVPSAVVLLDRFPLTENGKVDRRALPEPEAERAAAGGEAAAPRDALEEWVAALWREVLELPRVGIHDDFFDLGGNSLIGAVLINKLQERLGEIVHVVVIFDAPSVARLAEYLRAQHPVAVARLVGAGEAPAAGAAGEAGEAAPIEDADVALARELIRGMPRFTTGAAAAGPKNPPAVFVLSAPRSGSTLLRVMLGGHPGLFAPPELELLSFNDLADRRTAFSGRDAFWLEGLIRAVMELEGVDADAARERLAAWEAEALPTRRLYGWLAERLGERLLVDKTPSYSLREDVLARAEEDFEGALYVHLVRHPYGMIRSFEDAKLDQIFFPAEHPFTRRQLAELIWLVSEENVRRFLERVPPERRHLVRFEDLVERPEETLGGLCAFLGLPYDPAMADPYVDPKGRMTDGIHAQSRMLGDVKFHEHGTVEAGVAERWRAELRRDFLGPRTLDLAAAHGYERLERALPPLEPSGWRPGEPLPVSLAQERLWFLDQLDPGTHTYNIPVAVRLVGSLDAPALAAALADVAERQASLRTTLVAGADGGAAQVVARPAPPPLPVVDLSGLADGLRRREGERLAVAEARRPFDLACGPLTRALLVRLAAKEHALFLCMHHVVSDGWSMGVLVRELGSAYAARAAGRSPELPPLPVQYPDYAAWQRRTYSEAAIEGQLAYWRERLAGVPSLQLPTDRPRPGIQSFRGSTHPFRFRAALSDGLRRVGQEAGATRYATLLAAFQALLGRWAGQESLSVGSPFAGRNRAEVENLIGFFVNTLVLRADLGDDPPFSRFLARVRDGVREALAHQDVPFERVVQEVAPERNLSVPPLFQVMLAFQDAPRQGGLELPDLSLEPVESATAISKFDLTLTALESSGRLAGQWVWNVDLFDAATVERIGRSFEALLEAVGRQPALRVSELPLLSGAEREQVLEEWNRPPVDYPAGGSAHLLVAAQAAATPDAVALVWDGGRMSYGELARRIGRQAGRLRSLGVGPEALVGLACERSPEMVVALLAILHAGGAYVPLDPGLPAERLEMLASDAGLALVLTQERLLASGLSDALAGERNGGPRLVAVDAPGATLEAREPAGGAASDPEGAAYVIYTSGSTGRPKGVLVSHGALANRLQYARAVDMGPEDAFLQKTTISFDVSVLEILGPLVSGGRTVLPPPGAEKDTNALVRLIARERITQTSFPPTLLFALLEEEGFRRLDSLNTVITGGETVPPALAARFHRTLDAELLNRYGPTETTVSVTSWACRRGAAERSLPIGFPTARARIHVLDRHLAPVPPGVVGEVLVGGPGIARGYLGRPARTAEAFVPNPHPPAGTTGARLYRTGDLARFRPDGAVEFVGRADHQVKIRGFRVELGEIEAVLAGHPRVRDAVVVDRGEGAAKRLDAYVQPEEGSALEPAALRAFAAAALPGYMVPASFTVLDALPLTPTGKVDRAALPAPDAPAIPIAEEGGAEPRGPVEETVAAVWSDVLGREAIGRDQDFFDLGGHSLLATRVVSRLRSALGVDLPLRGLFEEPTVAGLARTVERLRSAHGAAGAPPIERLPRPERGPAEMPLSFAQERIWFLERMDRGVAAYNMLAAMRLHGTLDVPALQRSVGKLVRRHETLRTVFVPGRDEPVQRILPWRPVALPTVDLSGLGQAHRERASAVLVAGQERRPFDLVHGPLLRPLLVRESARDHAFLGAMHHAVADGWSLGVFVRELSSLYRAAVAGTPDPLPELPIQYADFAVWQREWLRGEVLEGQLGYWRSRLEGARTVLDLPTDRPRPQLQNARGATLDHPLPPELADRLRALARRKGATLFMVCMAGFQALLERYTGQGDLTVGTAVANRSRPELEGLVGFFVNALTLRGELSDDPSFDRLLERVREDCLGAYDHQDLPFEKLVHELQPRRDPSRSPLFQVLLQLHNAPVGRLELPDLVLSPVTRESANAKFDLILNLFEGPALAGQWRYRTDLFDATTVRRMARHLSGLLTAATEDPERPISHLPLLDGAERHHLLLEMAGGAGEHPAAATLDALFAARAATRPDTVALTCDDGAFSYRELDRRSAALARHLAALGVRPGARVAILLERSLDLVVAVLGAVRAGAAYVPLDPAYPAERLAFTLEDSGAQVLVTRSEAADGLPEVAGVGRVLLDEPAPAAPAGAAPTGAAGPDAFAYVIYTSGSTGRPKGVPVRHGNVARLFDATARWFDFGPDDAWTLFHSYAFDFSVWELWGALLYGGRLVVVPHAVSRAPADFHRLLARERVSFLNQTPSAFRQLARADAEAAEPLAALRTVVFGGEALELEGLAPWLSRYGDRRPTLVNMYGITETTVHVTYRPISREDLGRGRGSVVGRPIPDLSLHLLDRRLEPVPLGVAGEIHVGGAGLAAGYLGRPRLSAERFVPDPVGSSAPGRAGARLYRSGDLARRLADGDVEYLGRIDHQVKVRGFRIELGEVEAALAAHPDVGEAVVVAREAAAGEGEDRRLVAYVVPADRAAVLTVAELRRFVGERLPEHMVPSAFVAIESIPLTPNGKVDRRALPSPDLGRPDLGTGYVAPRDALERFLAGLWQRVLGVERVGVEDDFFDLGGNSLVGVTLVDRLQEALGEIVHVVVLFDAPSVARMADHLRRQHPDGVARITGERPAGAAAAAEAAPPVDAEMVERVQALVRGMHRFTVGDAGSGEPKNPPAVFVLSAPRSGSTLLRVMLGGHPRLFAPPELELLSFDTLADRRRAFQGRDAFWLEGAIRAVMELEGSDAEEARRRIEALEAEGTSTRRFYRLLQEALGDRLLVDKTPSYALREDVLARAERDFEEARYVHLVRHPYGMIRSFEEARLDQIFFPAEHPFTRRQLAELIWLVSERNVRRFLEKVPPRRQALVRFEDLVREPERTLRGLCAFLGLDFRPEMAQPYRDAGPDRMTDGIHESSRMLGDVKFHRHAGVDAAVADEWRRHYDRDFLGEVSWLAAGRYGYGSERARGLPVRSLVGLRSGGDEPPLFLVHPASGDVYFYRDMVAALPAGRAVYGFQAPGLDGREEPLATVEELAERYVESLLAFRPEGPYLLAGSSLGGTVAYEMARRLTAAGHEVAFLGMGDTAGVRQLPRPFAGAEAEAMVLGYLAGPIGAEPLRALEALAPEARPAFMVAELERAGRLREGLGEEALARLVRVIRSNQAAMIAYRPQPYEGAISFFRAADGGSRYSEPREEPWRPMALGGLSVRVIPGNHLSMNLPPNAEHLARAVHEEIEIAVARARDRGAVAAAAPAD